MLITIIAFVLATVVLFITHNVLAALGAFLLVIFGWMWIYDHADF